MLGDGDDPHTFAPEHRLERHGVLSLAGEAGEFPDQDDLKRGLWLAPLFDHLPELGPVGHAAALGLVHVFAGY